MNARKWLMAFAALMISLAASESAWAQNVLGYRGHSDNPNGPTVSPYLNLLNNNNQLNSVPNYQSLVRPLVDQQDAIRRQGNSLQRLQSQVNSTFSPTASGSGRGISATGHTSYFMNNSHYFPAGQGRGGAPR